MSPWRRILRRLAHRHRTLHAEEQWHLERLQEVRVSMCAVATRMDHVQHVMAMEVSR